MLVYPTIVEKINEVLNTSLKPFVSGNTDTINLFGLVNSYKTGEDSTAPFVNKDGELTPVLELDYPLTGYHRLNDATFTDVKSFGNNTTLRAKSNMSFIAIGERSTVNSDPESLALQISAILSGTSLKETGFKTATLSISGFNTDPLTILRSEFGSNNYDIKYNNAIYFAVKVNYSLTLDVVANCLTC